MKHITTKANETGGYDVTVPVFPVQLVTTSIACPRCLATGLRQDRTEPMPCISYEGEITCISSGERIRKNGTCSSHSCYTCEGDKKLSPRVAFIVSAWDALENADYLQNEVLNTPYYLPIVDADGHSRRSDLNPEAFGPYQSIVKAIREQGPSVSRSARWTQELSWFARGGEEDGNPRHTVTQGLIYLGHASK